VTTGTAISVTAGATHSGVNFGLSGGGTISGTVTDAATFAGLNPVTVTVYNSSGVGIKSATTSVAGRYTGVGLATGSYFARTFVANPLNYVDELFDNIQCAPSCTITSGTAIAVVAGGTTTANFPLSAAGSIAGTVTDAATTAGLGNVTVQVYNSTGTFVRGTVTTGTGSYSVGGLVTGTYYARTFVPNTMNYIDELWDNIPCLNCVVTTGTAIAVP